jgi:hypothetical protein
MSVRDSGCIAEHWRGREPWVAHKTQTGDAVNAYRGLVLAVRGADGTKGKCRAAATLSPVTGINTSAAPHLLKSRGAALASPGGRAAARLWAPPMAPSRGTRRLWAIDRRNLYLWRGRHESPQINLVGRRACRSVSGQGRRPQATGLGRCGGTLFRAPHLELKSLAQRRGRRASPFSLWPRGWPLADPRERD